MLGLSVRGPGGAPKPDLKQSAIRNAFTLLPVVPYVGGLLAFIAIIVIAVTISGSPTKQGKHDELAGGTQVVKGLTTRPFRSPGRAAAPRRGR